MKDRSSIKENGNDGLAFYWLDNVAKSFKGVELGRRRGGAIESFVGYSKKSLKISVVVSLTLWDICKICNSIVEHDEMPVCWMQCIE